MLRSIAGELSTGVHVSLMSQYHPVCEARNHRVLNLTIEREEYEGLLSEMERLGFRND
ncbi:MAG: hypothetical protein ACUVTX_07845 [Bacteroidales bacterium]